MMTNMTTTSSTTNNSTDKLPDFVHIFHVEEHDYWKPKVLKSIEEMKKEIKSLRQDVSMGKGGLKVILAIGTLVVGIIGFFQFK